jgi:hypothetical protein
MLHGLAPIMAWPFSMVNPPAQQRQPRGISSRSAPRCRAKPRPFARLVVIQRTVGRSQILPEDTGSCCVGFPGTAPLARRCFSSDRKRSSCGGERSFGKARESGASGATKTRSSVHRNVLDRSRHFVDGDSFPGRSAPLESQGSSGSRLPTQPGSGMRPVVESHGLPLGVPT